MKLGLGIVRPRSGFMQDILQFQYLDYICDSE
jgi:hypothetical protein